MGSEIQAPVLIADDGELREVRELLDSLDVPYAETGREQTTEPRLLISDARHAVARGREAGPVGTFHIVVAEKLSRTLQQQLARLRPDFLLERPVDPLSLRLLVLHALYGGPERRRSERAAMRAVVRYRTGLASRKATLVDLSQSGCRLLVRRALEKGERLDLRVPRELTGGPALTLRGRVVAVDAAEELEPGARAASVVFAGLDTETQRRVRAVMAEHAIGAGALRPHTGDRLATSAPESPRAPRPTPSEAPERRDGPRGVFERSILAAGPGGSRVLLGRDLSSGGMRVAPDLQLALGDAFNLVIHGPGDRRPTLVRAVVARDDGEEGWMLRFENLSSSGRATLDEIVAALPSVPGGTAVPKPNVVVSEVVGEG